MLLKQHSHSMSNEFVLCRLFVVKFVVVLTFSSHNIKQMVRINANLLSCNTKININADIISMIYVITFHIKRSIVDWGLSLWCEHQISLSENEINAPQTYKECDYMMKDVYTW